MISSERSRIIVDRDSRGAEPGLGKHGSGQQICVFLVPLCSTVAATTLFALQRGSDLDTGQALPATAQDALDAVIPSAEPAW
jgi:hypothetical protein